MEIRVDLIIFLTATLGLDGMTAEAEHGQIPRGAPSPATTSLT
jgi:hypothetical protein